MTEQELKQIWQESNLATEKINIQSPKLLSNMDKEFKRFENRIERRDNREIIAVIFSILFYGGMITFREFSLLENIGFCLLVAYSLLVVYMLLKVKNAKPTFSVSQSVKEQLINYKNYVRRQQKLLENVLYWYLLPMIPGIVFLLLNKGAIMLIGSSVMITLVFFGIYKLNKRAADENFNPLLDEISIAIKRLEEKD
ncbi:MAG: hypothetical protein AB8F94_04260 [Saprospiraceae bacterium]